MAAARGYTQTSAHRHTHTQAQDHESCKTKLGESLATQTTLTNVLQLARSINQTNKTRNAT